MFQKENSREMCGSPRSMPICPVRCGCSVVNWPHRIFMPDFQRELPIDIMRQAAAAFVGTHDFAAFAANRGTPSETTVRTISGISVRRNSSVITLDYSG